MTFDGVGQIEKALGSLEMLKSSGTKVVFYADGVLVEGLSALVDSWFIHKHVEQQEFESADSEEEDGATLTSVEDVEVQDLVIQHYLTIGVSRQIQKLLEAEAIEIVILHGDKQGNVGFQHRYEIETGHDIVDVGGGRADSECNAINSLTFRIDQFHPYEAYEDRTV